MGKARIGTLGLWLDEHKMVAAAKTATDAGYAKLEAYSPFPLHGIDDAMGIKRSWIPYVTFVFGLLGCAAGTFFTWWVSAVDWPLVIAGKPFWSLPAFVPVIFELVILFAALSSVATLFLQFIKVNPKILDADITSHKFALFVPDSDEKYNAGSIEKLFNDAGADQVRQAEG